MDNDKWLLDSAVVEVRVRHDLGLVYIVGTIVISDKICIYLQAVQVCCVHAVVAESRLDVVLPGDVLVVVTFVVVAGAVCLPFFAHFSADVIFCQ